MQPVLLDAKKKAAAVSPWDCEGLVGARGASPPSYQLPTHRSPAPGPWPGTSMQLHNGKTPQKGRLINLLATSGRVTTEAVRGLYLICGPPSNQGQVWDFQKSLSDLAAQIPRPFNKICAP